MSTPATKFLDQHKVAYKLIKYEHEVKGAAFAAKATGYELERTIKTLVVQLGNNTHVLVLLPGSKQLDLKKLAKAGGVKKAQMAKPDTAQRLTGYMVGGISPFGTRQKLSVFMDRSVLGFETILINGGKRGTMLVLSSQDMADALSCIVVDVSE